MASNASRSTFSFSLPKGCLRQRAVLGDGSDEGLDITGVRRRAQLVSGAPAEQHPGRLPRIDLQGATGFCHVARPLHVPAVDNERGEVVLLDRKQVERELD